jgi:plastocyanin
VRKHSRSLAVLTAAAVLLVPAAASAAGKTVTAGPHKKVKSSPGDANAFFPKTIKVAKGATVTFRLNGFHTVNLGKARPLFVPDATKPMTGYNDAAGKPFWFNGQPRLILNPSLVAPSGDGKVNKAGANNDDSGIQQNPTPYRVKFTRTGSYTIVCDVHPGMKGKVTVVKKGRKVPSAKADLARADAQLAKAVATLKKNDKFAGPADGSVRAGNDTRDTAIFKFFPANVNAKVGQPVKWQLSGVTEEIHNVVLGPEPYVKTTADAFVVPDTSSTPPALVANPLVFFPSDPPPAFPPYSTALHGNGFFNAGVMDLDPNTPSGNATQVTFSQPGTYTYWCSIHFPMKGTVTVTQ